MTDERAAELLQWCRNEETRAAQLRKSGLETELMALLTGKELRDLLAAREEAKRLREAASKYHCLVRSQAPDEFIFKAGKELDQALAGDPTT